MTTKSKISIYIHWPFCEVKCPYCDFNSFVQQGAINRVNWVNAYKSQLQYFMPWLNGREVSSIFLGGGTPSLMPVEIASEVLQYISKYAIVNAKTEITFEANPSSAEIAKFRDFKAAGFNRISIGVQSFNDSHLKFLGRLHNSRAALDAVKAAQQVFDNYSFDLIYALPGQTIQQWEYELHNALPLAGNHLSCYQLTIEKGTPFYNLQRQGKFHSLDQDEAYVMYQFTNEKLSQFHLSQYEISNYAQSGYECKHNLAYWNYDNYIGIGPGAHSRVIEANTLQAVMMWHTPQRWLDSCSQQTEYGIQNKTHLTINEILSEQIMMGLRLTKGIHAKYANKLLQEINAGIIDDYLNHHLIDQYSKEGLLDVDYSNTRQLEGIRLTAKGLALHSYVVPRLLVD